MKYFLKYVIKFKKQLVVLTILMLLATAFTLYLPLADKALLDEGLVKKDFLMIVIYLAVIFGVKSLNDGVTVVQDLLSTYVTGKFIYNVSRDIYGKIIRSPLNFFEKFDLGELTSRLDGDVSRITILVSNQFIDMVKDVCILLGIVCIMVKMNLFMFLLSLLAVPMIVIMNLYIAQRQKKTTRTIRAQYDLKLRRLQEVILGIQEVKGFNIFKWAERKFINAQGKIFREELRITKLVSVIFFISSRFQNIVHTGIYLFGAYLLVKGRLTIGELFAFLAYFDRSIYILERLVDFNRMFQSSLVSMERLYEMIETADVCQPLLNEVFTAQSGDDTINPIGSTDKPADNTGKLAGDTDKSAHNTGKLVGATDKSADNTGKLAGTTDKSAHNTGKLAGITDKSAHNTGKPVSYTGKPTDNGNKLAMYGVSFAYVEGNPVLHNIQLQIQPAEKVALVGDNGSGKSTILKLFTGLIQPANGVVSLDGVSLAQLTRREIARKLSYVTQKPFIFHGTIKENLLLSNQHATDLELAKVLQQVGLREYIKDLPDGIETPLTLSGTNLSGGQLQRLAIARALLKKTEVLLLDEPTANIEETFAEKFIEEMVNETSQTVVMTVHKESLLQYFDRVLYVTPTGVYAIENTFATKRSVQGK